MSGKRPMTQRTLVRTLVGIQAVMGLAAGVAEAQVVAGPFEHANSIYYLVGPTTWTNGENQALGLGGHLVTLEDAAENQWVANTFLPLSQGLLWLGLRADQPLGSWTWVSGSTASYRNWGGNEPNNGCAPELYALMGHFGQAWTDGPVDSIGCNNSPPSYGVVEVPCTIQSPPEWSWHGDTEFGTFGGDWGEGANWTPQSVPAHNGVANFNIPQYYFVDLEANHRVGGVLVTAGYPNLNFNGFTLDRPTDCTPVASLAVWPPPGGIAQLRLGVGLNGEGGRFNTPRAVAVALESGSTGVLEISGVTLDAGEYVFAGAGSGSTGLIELVAGGTLLANAGLLVGGRDGSGMVNVGAGGVLRIGATIKLGALPGGTGTLNIGNAGLVNSLGTTSQIFVGAEPGDVGGTTTIGLLNLHTGGVLDVTEVNLGAAERSRGTFTIDGGLLDAQSLIIGDRGIGQFEWSAGTITGLENIAIGKQPGSDGRLDLYGPAQSLTFASAGGNALIAVGQLGKGQLHVENGARVDLTAGSTSGMSIGIAAGARGFVGIAGPDSAVIADDASLLITGNSGTSGSLTEALVIEDHGLSRFGKAFIGNSPGQNSSYAGDATIHTRGRLEVTLAGDSIGGSDGLIVGNSDRSAGLNVESGGTVECTSGWAYNTNELGPVIHISGVEDGAFPPLPSSLTCTGNFYIAGQLPTGATMRVDAGAVISTSNLYLGWSAGTPYRGELELDGPRQVLTNSGTLTIGVAGDPLALGRLVLQNGAKVRTHRLTLGDAYFVTNGTVNNPQLMVGGSPLVPPDIHCDTLMVSDSFDLPDFDVSFGPGAGIGGHGTWPGDFTASLGGEVVSTAGTIASVYSPMPRLTIDGSLAMDATALTEIAATFAFSGSGEEQAPIGSFVSVLGDAQIDGTLRLSLWTAGLSDLSSFFEPTHLFGHTLPVLTAASITGTFQIIEFGPGFPTNRVQITYEPTQVLVTFLPPVCTSIQLQPTDDRTCPGGVATFTIAASGSPDGLGGPLMYQWEHEIDFNDTRGWFPINEGYNEAQFNRLYGATGTNSPALTLAIDPQFRQDVFGGPDHAEVRLRCIVSNTCSSIMSTEVVLRVCRADFNCDGSVDFFDYDDFILCFETSGCATADFNADGSIDFFDYDDFVVTFEAGC